MIAIGRLPDWTVIFKNSGGDLFATAGKCDKGCHVHAFRCRKEGDAYYHELSYAVQHTMFPVEEMVTVITDGRGGKYE